MNDNDKIEKERRVRNEIRDFCRGNAITTYSVLYDAIERDFPDRIEEFKPYSEIANDEVQKLYKEVLKNYERNVRKAYDDSILRDLRRCGDFDDFDNMGTGSRDPWDLGDPWDDDPFKF